MPVELSPTWDGRPQKVMYMEAFGRLLAGISPWLALPDDGTEESKKREKLRDWALKSLTHAVDPNSKDYLLWEGHTQILVDSSYIANSFLRAPKQLWEPLSAQTKARYIEKFKSLRKITPWNNNWMLFAAMNETFLMSIGEEYDLYRITVAINKFEQWYTGDGMYADGEHFALDYYNSYVIHPMLIDILKVAVNYPARTKQPQLDLATKRMQRYGEFLERLISPEATFPAFGRSIVYRLAAFQPLSLLALNHQLPKTLPEGQVRNALTAVMKRMNSVEGNFNKQGFLQIGLAGHQPDAANYYTNNGSLYITSLVFLALGLPADDVFWNAPSQDWTNKKAWSGAAFPPDKKIKY